MYVLHMTAWYEGFTLAVYYVGIKLHNESTVYGTMHHNDNTVCGYKISQFLHVMWVQDITITAWYIDTIYRNGVEVQCITMTA